MEEQVEPEGSTVKPASAVEPVAGIALDQEPVYSAIRRLIMEQKKRLGHKLQRHAWQCNGKGYVAYREFLLYLKRCEMSSRASVSDMIPGYGQQSLLFSWSPGSFSNRSTKDGLSRESSFVSRASFESNATSFYPSTRPVSEPGSSFAGMHHIFDECKASVNVLRFAHISSTLLAYGAANGTLAVCIVINPPQVLHKLHGHTKEITGSILHPLAGIVAWNPKWLLHFAIILDLDWSSNDQYICSSSVDKSLRIWEAKGGQCVRIIYEKTAQLCIRFHPVNNNLLLVGNSSKNISVFNFSTGRILHKLSLDNNITALDTDYTGSIIFAGDSHGTIHTVTVEKRTSVLTHAHRNGAGVRHKSATTTVQFKTFSHLTGGPVLLTSNRDGSMRFFSVILNLKGNLILKCSLQLGIRARSIRASFCPLLSLEKGEYTVSGNEDGTVGFYDLTQPKHPCVDKLQGHSVPVVGVAWNHGENFLASSDCEGLVIVWKRGKAGF